MLLMLPPTQYIQNHVYFTFVLFLTSYDSAYKKHTKDLGYAKPYYHTILPFFRKGVHFLMSSPSQLLLCKDFPDLRFSSVY